MPDVLIRGLDARLIASLKARARTNGRSLQAELRDLVERAAATPVDPKKEFLARLRRFRKRFGDRRFTSSVDLIREDRQR
ncbi:MAG: hypothetical protein HY294_02910 [Candidatus Rokubacteria bacterium]|nr:hypothetical protein [Candidatus Rokubacteria bacterium]MBI3824926.1 hypothetical protein [Candidatus Rokubacteria bacterium]